jgi:hypothetical protein
MRPTMSSMASLKPMSSMRSASSSTSTLMPPPCRLSRFRCSCTRPGVPTTMCGSCVSEASCGPSGMPPHSVSSFTLGMFAASLRIALLTWSASSRVGHSTSACSGSCRIRALQQAQPERRGLAAARLRLRDHVAPFQHRRQALRLHRGHVAKAVGVAERFDHAGEQGGFERDCSAKRYVLKPDVQVMRHDRRSWLADFCVTASRSCAPPIR